jgi:capsule polysaccharide export protein KpsE/RkpR
MDNQERLNVIEQELVLVKKRSEKAEKKIDELESIVGSLRNRLDKVQSQLSGGEAATKVVWTPVSRTSLL